MAVTPKARFKVWN